uniref:Gdp-L-Fucose Synthetase n=1 Tax=Florenciella sp. virus SA2 TaxID=3240092 RepID=A0AB39J8S4_9VIRU
MKTVIVTGGSGLVGKAIQNILDKNEETNYNYIFVSSKDVDLTDYNSTLKYFKEKQPFYVIHLAAYVGGLFKNMNYKVDMYEKNISMNNNVLKCSHEVGVKKVVSCLSTCIFPDKTKYPINEQMLHDGPPHFSNDAYAYAKRMLEVQSKAYQEQYNDNFICVIPTNIYGEHDNYSLEDGHVIPSLIHRCYLSKKENTNFVVRGTGRPLRQFIYSKDLAKLILWTLFEYDKLDTIILSVSETDEVSIKDVAYEIAKNYDYSHKIVFDDTYSDGQYKKTADNNKLIGLNKNIKFTPIKEGIKNSVEWFNHNYPNVRY